MLLYVFSSFLFFLLGLSVSISLQSGSIQNEMTSSSRNTTNTSNLRIRCDQSQYGRPQLESCRNAAAFIGWDLRERTFRHRADRLRADYELPVTYMSGRFSDLEPLHGFAFFAVLRLIITCPSQTIRPAASIRVCNRATQSA